MQQIKSASWLLFGLNGLLNIFAVATQNQDLNYITKPLLMPLLALSLWLSAGNEHRIARNLVLLGLLLSTGGDTLLMLTHRPDFFIFGLICFLLAHVFYILAFRMLAVGRKGYVARHIWLFTPFLLYWLAFNAYLYNDLPAGLKLPVLVYSIAIMIMGVFALNLRDIIPRWAFLFIFIGAMLFLVSDSILALGRFKFTDGNFGIPIMVSYILGQFGIAFGTSKTTGGH